VTVAAVDASIFNLTHYEAPDPLGYFFGQRQLNTEIRDLYGLLIDGMQGSRTSLNLFAGILRLIAKLHLRAARLAI
jgi:alpha-2-macroglobulin